MAVQLTGLGGGFDWHSMVDSLVDLEAKKQIPLQNELSKNDEKVKLLNEVTTKLTNLKNSLDTLNDPSVFFKRKTIVSNSTDNILTAQADPKTPIGKYIVSINQLATNTNINGVSNLASFIHSENVSTSSSSTGPILSSLNLKSPIQSGFFTINNKQITLSTADTLQDVFNNIKSATNDDIEASYDATTDKITLTSNSSTPIILGSSIDTSNFLTAFKLFSKSGTPSYSAINSEASIGSISMYTSIQNSGLKNLDSLSASGSFKINEVSFTFDKSTESILDITNKINTSPAGVTLQYDHNSNNFTLENKESGSLGISLDDTSGNFLSTIGFTGSATTSIGLNAAFSIDGRGAITSTSNTIDESNHGISGLTIHLKKEGESDTVEVLADTEQTESKINSFLTEYNNLQSFILEKSAIKKDSNGKMINGPLYNLREVFENLRNLRKTLFETTISNNTIASRIQNIGIDYSTTTDTITVKDPTKLKTVLNENVDELASLFTDSTNGLIKKLSDVITQQKSKDSSIATYIKTFQSKNKNIHESIEREKSRIKAYKDKLTQEFLKSEQMKQHINTQSNYLSKNTNF